MLIAGVFGLVVAAFVAPRILPPPGIEENRVLSEPLKWPTSLKELKTLRRSADGYVTDRFPPREHLIGVLNRLRMLVGVSGSDRVIVGRDGYLFFDVGTHLGAARNDPPMDGAATRGWLLHLAGRTEALRARGIPYLVLAAPTKELVYPQLAPSWLGEPSPQRPTVVLPQLARTTGAGEVLYLHHAVADATRKGWKTYSRHDTHWTGYGTYAGYVALLSRLNAMGVTGPPLPLARFPIATDRTAGPKDLALMLGVGSMVDVDFPHITNPAGQAKITYLSARRDMTGPQVIDTGETGKPVLLLTRDSFSIELLPLLLPHFSRIVLAHNQDGAWRPDLIDRFKPNVVIVETIEHGLPSAMDTGPLPSATATARIDAVLSAVRGLDTLVPKFQTLPGTLLRAMNTARHAKGCAFDAQGIERLDHGSTVSAGGWISELRQHATSPDGYLRLQGPGIDWIVPMRVDGIRPDVAAATHEPSAERSGFLARFDAPELRPGQYALTVYRQAPGGRMVSCPGEGLIALP